MTESQKPSEKSHYFFFVPPFSKHFDKKTILCSLCQVTKKLYLNIVYGGRDDRLQRKIPRYKENVFIDGYNKSLRVRSRIHFLF